ncbi:MULTISPECIES: fimbrial protein [unclassified Burkholderia]|uniref:fimbrial protein n=1 Tax=unclassified Burkholderia TaxID=2613784 RepID=UPI0007C7A4B4|nr:MULTISPECIES: fimbrial protein [unclassified Burkholderia]
MKYYRRIPFIICLALSATHVFAADGTITFTGTINSETCQVTVSNVQVVLPAVQAATLKADGATAGDTRFDIQLTGCDPQASNSVRAAFASDTHMDPQTGNLIVDHGDGDAKNIEIGLRNLDHSPIHVGDPAAAHAFPINQDGNARLTYIAQYVATGGAAESGTVKSDATFTLNYQ